MQLSSGFGDTFIKRSLYAFSGHGAILNASKTSGQTRVAAPLRHRKGRLILLLIIVGMAIVVWVIQRSGPPLSGWGKDLEAAMKQASEGRRRAVILFQASSPSQPTRDLIKRVLGHSETKKALEGGKFIRVQLKTSLGSPVAKEYKIRDLPTVVIVDSEGKELNRRVGYISFAEFLAGFLDCTQIVKP